MIYKASKNLRLGVSYQTPIWYSEIIEDTNIVDNDGYFGVTEISVSEDEIDPPISSEIESEPEPEIIQEIEKILEPENRIRPVVYMQIYLFVGLACWSFFAEPH